MMVLQDNVLRLPIFCKSYIAKITKKVTLTKFCEYACTRLSNFRKLDCFVTVNIFFLFSEMIKL
jgi:hypothetical protein